MKYPYQNSALPIQERVADLLGRLSLKEKVGQVNQHLYGWQTYHFDPATKAVQLTDDFTKHLDWGAGLGAIYGLFRADPWSKVDYANGVLPQDAWRVSNAIQHAAITHSRWGIPTLITEECPHGHQGLGGVSYPTNIGRGNSFDTDLIRESAHQMARELALKGVNLALVSTLDLAKDPRWGRTEECFGEDPILSARFSQAVVDGFQGNLIRPDHPFTADSTDEINKHSDQIGVVLKHCIAQGEAQGGHNSGTVVLGNREFSEIYHPLLQSVQNAAGIMAAYNDVDGIPCHINHHLLHDLVRDQYGFQGLVMADGTALDRLDDVFDDQTEAAGAALNAGVDLSLWDDTYTQIATGIHNGKIDGQALDRAVAHVLSIKFLLGLFEHPYVSDPGHQLDDVIQSSQQVNEQLAAESITLVKNDGTLPLTGQPQNIAVIGPNANAYYNLLGDYTAPQSDQYQRKTIVSEIKREFPNATITYAQGCEIRNHQDQQRKIKTAISVAQNADVILLALGGSSARNFNMEFLRNGAVSSKGINMDSGENVDVADLSLGGEQLQLLKAISHLHKPTVAVMIQGRPYDLRPVLAVSNAVLVGWFPGQMGAVALAKLISGRYNPSGRLSLSYPLNSQQLPVYYYQRAVTKQDDYYDEQGQPLFDFGYGLSYTNFKYHDLTAQVTDQMLHVTLTVTNTGDCSGNDSVLLFLKLHGGHIIQRKRMLRAFKYVTLAPHSGLRVRFELPLTSALFYNEHMQSQLADRLTISIGKQTVTVNL